MTYDTPTPEQAEVVRRVARLLQGGASKMIEHGVSAEAAAQGAWAAALALGQDACGLGGLIEWLRNSADELEDRLAAQMAERARRPN